MARRSAPGRSKKAVDYAESEDDEDFAAPTRKSKRARSQSVKQIQSKEGTEVPKTAPNKRVALDDKVYQRDLEVTLALSLNEYLESSSKPEEGVPADQAKEPNAAAENPILEAELPRQGRGAWDNDGGCGRDLKRPSDQGKPQPPLQTEFSSSQPIGKPLKTSSPSASKKPSWTPPAASGSKGIHLERVPVKSPVPGLRLGLSRFAKVKPLHPNVASP